MRTLLICCLAFCPLAAYPPRATPAPEQGKADAGKWTDLLAGKGLSKWKRVPIPPERKLSDRDPWKFDAATGVLSCAGEGIKEMLLYDRAFRDGVFHVEWRFKKVEGKQPEYNSGIYVRTGADGMPWFQAQVAHTMKPPRMADLFGQTSKDGKSAPVVVEGSGHKLIRPAGEWNIYEITCQGKRITVKVNGKTATTWNDCPALSGHVGLQAEFFNIEFKNLKFAGRP